MLSEQVWLKEAGYSFLILSKKKCITCAVPEASWQACAKKISNCQRFGKKGSDYELHLQHAQATSPR